jgi:hypothetical protein
MLLLLLLHLSLLKLLLHERLLPLQSMLLHVCVSQLGGGLCGCRVCCRRRCCSGCRCLLARLLRLQCCQVLLQVAAILLCKLLLLALLCARQHTRGGKRATTATRCRCECGCRSSGRRCAGRRRRCGGRALSNCLPPLVLRVFVWWSKDGAAQTRHALMAHELHGLPATTTKLHAAHPSGQDARRAPDLGHARWSHLCEVCS